MMPGTRGRVALHRGHKAPAACNRRFVPPAVRRREQDEIDLARIIAVRRAFGMPVDQTLVDAFYAERGSW